jgi:hypothetical protein
MLLMEVRRENDPLSISLPTRYDRARKLQAASESPPTAARRAQATIDAAFLLDLPAQTAADVGNVEHQQQQLVSLDFCRKKNI